MNLSRHEEAIGCFEQQIACLEQMDSSELNPATAALHNKDVEKGRAFGHLGNCYEALTDFEEAAKCHEQYLSHSLRAKSVKDQDKAYTELGQAYKHLGNLQQALVSELFCIKKEYLGYLISSASNLKFEIQNTYVVYSIDNRGRYYCVTNINFKVSQ